jgi:RNA-directed DNA polymerase
MSKILEQASSPEIINAAWKYLHNDKAIWQPGISKKEMGKNFTYHIIKLARELRSGEYQPDPVRFFTVNKKNGKPRIISALTLRDKVAQRAVLKVIEPGGENIFHHNSYGYRPGRNTQMACSKVREYLLCGLLWLVDADIKNCFESISHSRLLKVIKKNFSDKNLIGLIKKWLCAGNMSSGIFSSPRGIPQGAILSPFFCNLYLTFWDNTITSKNFPFVRFADDFIVFANSKKEAGKAYKIVEKTLKKIDLELNLHKTRIVHCSPKIKFLGQKLPDVRKIKHVH